jgi:hypothetical protein
MPAGMEMFAPSGMALDKILYEWIDESDFYLIIIGNRYGTPDASGKSYTQLEYEYAKKTKKVNRIIPIILDENYQYTPEELNVINSMEEESAENKNKLKVLKEEVSKTGKAHVKNFTDIEKAISSFFTTELPELIRIGEVKHGFLRTEKAPEYLYRLLVNYETVELPPMTNYRKLLMNWRFEREGKKFKAINEEKWKLLASEPSEYIRYIINELMKRLTSEDIYRTVTELKFWGLDRINYDKETKTYKFKDDKNKIDFLKQNFLAIKNEDLEIHRIVILNENYLDKSDDYNSEKKHLYLLLCEHKEMLEKLKGDGKESLLNIKFCIFSNDEYEVNKKAFRIPYAVMSKKNDLNGKENLMIFPNRHADPAEITIEMPTTNTIKEEKQWWKEISSSTILSIDEMREKMRIILANSDVYKDIENLAREKWKKIN